MVKTNIPPQVVPRLKTGMELRRVRKAINRKTSTITLDPLTLQFVKMLAKETSTRVSYILEDALLESGTLRERIEKIRETRADIAAMYDELVALARTSPGFELSEEQKERLVRHNL